MNQLYDRYLGPHWREEPGNGDAVEARRNASPTRSCGAPTSAGASGWWRIARRKLREQLERRGASQPEIAAADEVLDPEALTIGFARRFATYKRATLILRDPERLARILNDPQRPVQIIFAGKAHPRDNPGKELIRQMVQHARERPEFRRRIVFLEDYDMPWPRYLVQGCDVWLNTPLRPHGSQRHQRHEGGGQRRAQPEHAGRLVGRSVARIRHQPDRLGDRPRRELRRPRLPGPGGGAGALRPAGERRGADVLRPRARTTCRGAGLRA